MIRFILAAVAVVSYPLLVDHVHDGDTFTGFIAIRPGLVETVTVRLPCGNAAELKADGGIAALDALRAALDAGNGTLALDTTWAKEKYGRLLASPYRVQRDGGRGDICAELRDGGWVQ